MAPKQVRTVTDALRIDARMWDEQSATLGSITHALDGLRMTRIEAGVFQVIFSAYEEALNVVSDRCAEGQDRMAEIASALIKNARAYDNNEDETTETVKGSY
ncbi:hypothetical protein ABZW18_06450 [Streptomyces sp. NPDC004647]|uniref:hypothetical protein n=1 Tax=Streptomyces sp. NPDC004647 TaxID=3154671 RepID=UPI0033ADB984